MILVNCYGCERFAPLCDGPICVLCRSGCPCSYERDL
jgi:hypothetical protein